MASPLTLGAGSCLLREDKVPDLFRYRHWDLVGSRRIWFAISIITILVGMGTWFAHGGFNGGLNYGIDFTGGGLLTYKLPADQVADKSEADILAEVRAAIPAGLPTDIQLAGTVGDRKDLAYVRTQSTQKSDQARYEEVKTQSAQILAALQEKFPGIEQVGTDVVGGVVSQELTQRALQAVIIGSLLVMVWILIRYDLFFGQWSPKWAVSAIIALGHDILVLVGVFALTRLEVNSPFVAAILTVVGYSVHDTIVIFDRIRENLKLRKGNSFAETTNISLLETMARSVNTVLTVEFTLLALILFGGPTLKAFSWALFVGVTTGAYSSIFNASQILVVLKNREAKGRQAVSAAKAAARPTRLAAPEPVAAVTAGGETVSTTVAAPKKASKGTGAKKKGKRRF